MLDLARDSVTDSPPPSTLHTYNGKLTGTNFDSIIIEENDKWGRQYFPNKNKSTTVFVIVV